MITFKQNRILHKWIGIIFLFPAFLISITAILLALNGVLNLDKIKTNIPTMAKQYNSPEIKSVCFTPSKDFIGSKNGLIVAQNDSCYIVPELSGFDIKSIIAVGDTVFIASKQGLWKYHNNSFIQIFEKDIHSISLYKNNMIVVSLGKKGFEIVDFNGNIIENEKKSKNIEKQLAALSSEQPQTLHKLVMGLHTGEAIVGKTLESYWIALCGLQLLLLTLTGCWFVFKTKKTRKQVDS